MSLAYALFGAYYWRRKKNLMRKISLIALAPLFFATSAFSQLPDPRDSIILESKTVAPGVHVDSGLDTSAYLYIRVFITNKDSLISMYLALEVSSTSGGAYAILGRPRAFFGMVNPLTNTLRYGGGVLTGDYHGNSPDTFLVAANYDPLDLATFEPPNDSRKAIWELKFDSVWATAGNFEIDSIGYAGTNVGYTNTVPQDLPVNFVKSIITVPVAPKGDLNWDLALTAADVTLILNCIFCGNCGPPPVGTAACDLNCDGMRTPADAVLELYAVFLGRPLLC